MNRLELSQKYAKGNGLEIAPLHNPWPTHLGIESMFYIDLFTNDQLREQYPEHKNDQLCRIDAIDDGQFCEKFSNDSFDFVFSSHVLEHCHQVIETIRNWLRVVKNGGHVIMAIPLMHNPIDKNRSPATFNHLSNEFTSGRSNYREHYMEYHCIVDGLTNEKLRERVELSLSALPHIHFHCWDLFGLKELFEYLLESRRLIGFNLVNFIEAGHEVFVVLQKTVSGDLKWK